MHGDFLLGKQAAAGIVSLAGRKPLQLWDEFSDQW